MLNCLFSSFYFYVRSRSYPLSLEQMTFFFFLFFTGFPVLGLVFESTSAAREGVEETLLLPPAIAIPVSPFSFPTKLDAFGSLWPAAPLSGFDSFYFEAKQ